MNKKVIRLGAEDDECAKQYNFDGTFNPDCTQEEVFQVIAKPSIEHVLKGYTAAIMAYGQTGTGKSFTMSNMKPGQEGVIPRSAGYLFDLIEKDTSSKYTLSAHFVQIYRDTLSDLMVEEGTSSKTDIHYTPQTGVEITNAVKTPINSKQDFLDMYQTGDVRRVVRATKMNPESSRGHTALVLYVSVEPTDPDNMNCATKGKITFIDLAGYERFEKTGLKDPIHKDEAKKINASLLSLGTVVTALSENMSHVPWRNSKLTRLLQDSIGGKSRSTIMITVGPSSSHNHETTNSLDFGNRAMAVKVSAKLEQITDFKKLAAKLQELLDEKEEKISKLEVAAKVREAERAERDRRQKMDLARLRARHQEELTNLMNNGATPEAIQALLKQHEIEDENMEEMQVEERELDEERHEEEERELVAEIEAEHRVRAQSMKREGGESKQKELDAAYALIAQLRGSEGSDTNTIAKEIAELAGVDPDDAAAAASPKTVTSAEVAILRREADQLRLECETEKQNAEEKVEKAKNALKKCAGLLKEEREKNKRLSEESVKAEELEKLQGEIEEIKNAKQLATEHRDELQEKLEKSRNSQSKLMSDKKEVMKQKEELEANYKKQAEDSSEKQADYDKKLAELNAQIAKLEEEIKTLSEQLQEATAATEGLQKTISEKEDQLTKSVAELEEALSKLANNETSLTEEQESRRKRERELEKAVEQCRDETRDVEKSLQQEIEEIQISCSSETQTLKDKIAELQQSLDEMGNDKGELSDALVKLRTALEESNENLSQGEKRVRELILDLDTANETITDLNQKLEQQQQDSNTAQKAADEEKEDSEREIAALTTEVTTSKTTIRELEDKLKILEDDLNEEIARIQKKNEQLQEDASLQNADSSAALETLKQQRDTDRESHEAELQELKEQHAAKLASVEEAHSLQLTELNEKLSEAETQLKTTEDNLTAATSEQSDISQKLNEATANLSAAEEEKTALSQQITDLEDQLTKQHETTKNELSEAADQYEQLQTKLSDVEEKLAVSEEQLTTLKSDYTGLESRLDEQTESAADEREKFLAEIEEHKTLQSSTSAELTAVTEARDAATKQAEETNAKLETLQIENEESKEEFQTEKAILEEELEAANEEKEEALAEVERTKAESEEEIEKLTVAHAEEIEKNETAANEYAALLEARVAELEDKLKELQGDLSDEKTKAELELMELKKKKDEERETERQRLNDEKDRLNDEKAELEAKVKSRGKYKYKSSLISQLITCGQLAVPSSAPRLAPPHDILASLNPEHVKQACRYRLIITGHQHTGKSSVYKCLSHEGSVSILGKKAPDVVSPTTTMQCTEHTVREKGKGFLSKKSSLTTHFQVWDTPSDLKVMAALPEGVLPITGCAYVLTYYLTREFKSESQRMDEVLYSILTNTRAKLDKVKMKLPILLVGTRKDMLPSRDSNVLLGKINEARRWFNDNPIAQNYFSLVGVYASSCKDWSVYSDTGKNGISTFGGIMSYVAEEVRRLYPNTPPAMLGEKTNDADADLGDWLAGNKSVSSDSQRMAQAVHKALLSSIMSFDIMKRRGAWLLGNQEFRGILQDNIPDHVLETFPDLADTFISVFEARGYILHIKDSAFDDERESCFVIKVGVLIDFITSLMLPTLYLQLVPSYANDKPGYLKTSMLKSSGFNIEEVWRPDWELIFDGHMTGTSTSSLLKNSLAFQNDPMLGSSLLECLHCGFRMKTSKDERITFVTGIAIRSLVPELEGVFLALFDKHSTGWTAATAKIDSISQQDVVKVQQKIFSEQEDCLLWNDAVAFNRGDTWTFIRMRKNEIVVCTGKSDMNMFADMKKTVETIFGISQFRDGMKLDHLPSLTPALQDAIKESTSISEYLNSLSKDQIRGISFPSDSLDRDSGRRRPPVSIHRDSNGSSPASGKISADRMAMFQ
eukprot:TRINITY_DN645_c0_g1_i8.p1 TRINITY_DN645_c0_g1~~TRINITY_DN645_c0_g1_i8.p1  ORF type:complete len:2001 (+),score=574.52 TRINITY_DN645_c0_g1_i8:233-6004(+)